MRTTLMNKLTRNQRPSRPVRVAALLAAALLLGPAARSGAEAPILPAIDPAIELPANDSPALDSPLAAAPLDESPDETAPGDTAPVVTVQLPAETPATQPATMPATLPTTMPVAAASPEAAPAIQPTGLFENLPADGRVHLLVGRSMLLKTRTPFKRVSLTQPEVASDNEVDPSSILLTAKRAGSAQLIVWDDKDASQVVDVQVDVDLVALSETVNKSFPTSKVQLSSANGTLVIHGRVPSLQISEQVRATMGRASPSTTPPRPA